MDPETFHMYKSYPYGELGVGTEVEIKEKDGETITTDVIFGFYRTSALTVTGRRICGTTLVKPTGRRFTLDELADMVTDLAKEKAKDLSYLWTFPDWLPRPN